MSLFKSADNATAYLKAGFMGEAGSGKTHTSVLAAIGLIRFLRERNVPGSERPVYMLDTEAGSSWIKPMFDEAGIELRVARTRAFKDLVPAVRDAEKNASLLLIDSITHFWEELKASYMVALNARRAKYNRPPALAPEFQDWAFIKREWGAFSDAFVASSLHIIMSGRLGWEYEQAADDNGKKQIEKSGVKMQAEKGLGYEPNLLVWMERDLDLATRQTTRTATILKDRSRTIDGKQFTNPTFATFLPHVSAMALGGRHDVVDTARTSVDTMPATDEGKRDTTSIRREIEVDLIQALMVEHVPGQTAADKQRKLALLLDCFGTKSWTEIEKLMPLDKLRDGVQKLERVLTGKPEPAAPSPAETADLTTSGPVDEAELVLGDAIAALAEARTAADVVAVVTAHQTATASLDAARRKRWAAAIEKATSMAQRKAANGHQGAAA